MDVRVEVASPGGHSSVPPTHTVRDRNKLEQLHIDCSFLQSIGILSSLLVHIEANPYVPLLKRGTPMYQKSQCLAAYASGLPSDVRKSLRQSIKSDKALHKAAQALFEDPKFKALVQTTQAIDIVNGGVKTNALPESAWAVVNHRVATDRYALCRTPKMKAMLTTFVSQLG